MRFLLMPPVAGILLVGLWFFAGRITDNFRVSAALTVLWFAVAGLAVFAIAQRWRIVAVPVVAAFLITTVASGSYLAWTTLRDTVVHERVAVASPGSGNIELASGHFTSDEHHTTGTAKVIRVASGERKLTLDLSTSAGPDLRVYLVPGDGHNVSDHRDLGGLKGNKGTQQYTIPPGVSTSTYTAVVIYCRAFSAPFGTAVLTNSA
jgi:hypothetical protein